MEQKTRFRYLVSRGEKITVTVTPVSVGPRVTATDNETPLDNVGSTNKPRFRIVVQQVPGNSHFVVLDFDFVEEDDDNAFFKIDLSSSAGDEFLDAHRVKKSHKVHRPVFRFEVTK